jgi:hypothetical protein
LVPGGFGWGMAGFGADAGLGLFFEDVHRLIKWPFY